MLSDLIDTGLTDEELMRVGLLRLVAGLDTTACMLALGTFALLSYPAQCAALRAEPEIADNAVEELLRCLSVARRGAAGRLDNHSAPRVGSTPQRSSLGIAAAALLLGVVRLMRGLS
ncbi:hypothetical protein WMF00_49300 [Sorangium sp. So ce1182]